MAKASVDPAELRRFAQELKRFNDEMSGLVSSLNAKVQSLENTWRDQEFRKFAESFNGAMKVLGGFVVESQEHVGILAKKANAIEEYLKVR